MDLSKVFDTINHELIAKLIFYFPFALNEIDICNFADDTSPYVCYSNLKST